MYKLEWILFEISCNDQAGNASGAAAGSVSGKNSLAGGNAAGNLAGYGSVARRDSMLSCEKNLPARFAASTMSGEGDGAGAGGASAGTASGTAVNGVGNVADKASHEGMVWIAGGQYLMGAADDEGRPDEYPRHPQGQYLAREFPQ